MDPLRNSAAGGEAYYGFALPRSRFAPVCGAFGGFATFVLMPQRPLLFKEGNVPKVNIANSFTPPMAARISLIPGRLRS